jgi:hypothetical protein
LVNWVVKYFDIKEILNCLVHKLNQYIDHIKVTLMSWSGDHIHDQSSNECPGDTRCWLTGNSVFFERSLLCPFILLLNGWTLSPTYCDPQTWRSRRYTTLGVLQLTLQKILYSFPVYIYMYFTYKKHQKYFRVYPTDVWDHSWVSASVGIRKHN